jgi:acetyl-CoA carboxylase biotin carboxyl carrier protein
MTQNELKELIDIVAEKGFAEFEVERSGFKLRIVASHGAVSARPDVQLLAPASVATGPLTGGEAAPSHAASAASFHASEPVSAPEKPSGAQVMRSPIVGTFYRSPSPTADPFVKIGDRVEAGTVVCIVEAMKLMNEIESEFSGEIVKIFVENGQPVEYGQPLFAIES